MGAHFVGPDGRHGEGRASLQAGARQDVGLVQADGPNRPTGRQANGPTQAAWIDPGGLFLILDVHAREERFVLLGAGRDGVGGLARLYLIRAMIRRGFPDHMPLSSGSRLGAYEIAERIGSGGMGEVFRAVDTHLRRTVAIKVLPSSLAHDADRLARFEREAHTLAALNHPNIAQVYGFEKGADPALVMEFVDGPTLAERIAAGPVAVDEAAAIALQIAEALESAHDLGIVHRDLKPANIKVRADGTVKVLDFGLAKAVTPEPSSASLANSPTITTPAMTQAGVVLGTAAYMSPEQAKGKPVDRRTDIWAFGCVLFEMLTGTRVFAGDDVGDVLVAILRDEPDWSVLPGTTPPYFRSVLEECLRKDVRKRMPHIGVARIRLSESASSETAVNATGHGRRRTIRRTTWLIAGALPALILGWWLSGLSRPHSATIPDLRFAISPPAGYRLPGANGVPRFNLSRNGELLIFEVARAARAELWVRPLADPIGRAVPGVESASDLGIQQPFFAPDGLAIAYFDELSRKLKTVPLEGGTPVPIADVPGAQFGGSWSEAGQIVFSTTLTGGVVQIPAGGGQPVRLTTVDGAAGEVHLFPEWLPDSSHFVFLSIKTQHAPQIYIASAAGGPPKPLLESPASARVAGPDSLLYLKGDQLMAHRIDLKRLELVGEPQPVAADVASTSTGRAGFAVAESGVLVLARSENRAGEGEVVWVDRAGRPVAEQATVPDVLDANMRLSHDGKLLAMFRSSDGGGEDLWIQDLVRSVPSKLGAAIGVGVGGLAFSPDDRWIFYRIQLPTGELPIMKREVSGVSKPQVVLAARAPEVISLHDVTPNGAFLLMSKSSSVGRDVLLLPIGGGSTRPFLSVETQRLHASLSPDGQYVAYTAGGRTSQVFVQTFPEPNRRWPLAGVGSSHPRWSHDGRTIYFLDEESRLSAVDVKTSPRLEIGMPRLMWGVPLDSRREAAYPYDVSPDGQRFAVFRRKPGSEQVLQIISNWRSVRQDRRSNSAPR